jgi:hypothetical protein
MLGSNTFYIMCATMVFIRPYINPGKHYAGLKHLLYHACHHGIHKAIH